MRIGIVLNVLNEEYQISIFKGINEAAQNADIELVCFQLEGVPFSTKNFANKFPAYKYFGLDGIILITASVFESHILKEKSQIENLWPGIPVVSIGQSIFGIPSILMQTGSSMKMLLEHLIRHHHYKNFLFIQGPEFHEDANERKFIFEHTMDIYKNIIPQIRYSQKKGSFVEIDGTTAIDEYYKDNHSFPDVVVCANDNAAIGVYKFLQMHSDEPNLCAVTGFDDTPQSKFLLPSLTTVHQPLHESGVKAIELIGNLVQNKQVEMTTFVDSHVVIRESCGCVQTEERNLASEKKVREIQRNYIHSERNLQLLGYLGQELIFCDSYDFLRNSLDNYFNQLDINEYYAFIFTKEIHPQSQLAMDKVKIRPAYLKKNGCDLSSLYDIKKASINQIIDSLQKDFGFSWNKKMVKYLNNTSDLIGFVIYEADENRLPFMCSVAVTLSQTLFRINHIEQEKKRAEYLEKEVTKRTAELVKLNNQKMKVEAEVLKISEIERQRFSLDLHDDICQRLAGISMLCRSYSNIDEGIKKEQMVELAQLINDTLQRTRQYAHNSYPVELDNLGLDASLNNLCNSFRVQNDIECNYEWKVSDSMQFTNTQKLNIFRIVQEALHNVSKHACASKTWVEIRNEKNKVFICIKDNGKGYNKEDIKNKGLGLSSMEYRANQIDGEIKIKNNNPSGTFVEFTFEC